VLCPAPLRPGDLVQVIAPSGAFDRALVLRGIAWLGERYRVRFDWRACERAAFFAGNDQRRLVELNGALESPDVRAIVTARGGHGLLRIAHLANWAALCDAPKWLVGFSDSTLLHLEASRAGVASLHADNAGGLGRAWQPARQRWLEALETPARERVFSGLTGWYPGRARGPLSGGNLTLLHAAAAAGRLYVPSGAVLALEDVSEAAYRVDRMLSALRIAGAFDDVAGVIVGDFVDCPPSVHGVSVWDVLREHLNELRVPVVAGFPFGHGLLHNEPLPFGLVAAVDARAGTLTLCPSAAA
jgi:muramoyltetrapeptide carboxypeptidase